MTLDELITVVEATGITVAWARFERINAGWEPASGTIWLDERLDGVNALCVLAHEYAHALLGHNEIESRRCEREADMVAARLLVDPADFARAESLHGTSTAGVADELGVTRWIVAAYRDWLSNSRMANLMANLAPVSVA